MNIVLLTHPDFLGSNSQPRFARMLLEAYRSRGHQTELRQPVALLRRVVTRGGLAKWAGYVDQYIFFALALRRRMAADPAGTLYVVCDQALGPWVPLLAHRPHVIHCHDLLALRSALGLVPQNPTGWSGRLYQRWIRAGFRRGRHFISISERTREELHRWGGVRPVTSEVVPNGLNHCYRRMAETEAAQWLRAAGLALPEAGFALHVGGGQWYKNTEGVIALYEQWAAAMAALGRPVPGLVVVDPPPGDALRQRMVGWPKAWRASWLQGVDAPTLQALYSSALFLLFPSLAEGFGWPIAEGLACGCAVVTTDDAPMTEVGGTLAHYLPLRTPEQSLERWALAAVPLLMRLLDRPQAEREADAVAAQRWAARYEPALAVERYLQIYANVLALEQPARGRTTTREITP